MIEESVGSGVERKGKQEMILGFPRLVVVIRGSMKKPAPKSSAACNAISTTTTTKTTKITNIVNDNDNNHNLNNDNNKEL